MNAYSAVLFLNELLRGTDASPCKREATERVKAFLIDYCMFYLAKNLPVILRKDKQRLLGLPDSAIHELIKASLYYVVDARADIEIVLHFAAKIFADDSILSLFKRVHDRMLSCCGFDQQHIPKMAQIKDMSASESFAAEFMEGFDYRQIK